jgi:hypothetical protein
MPQQDDNFTHLSSSLRIVRRFSLAKLASTEVWCDLVQYTPGYSMTTFTEHARLSETLQRCEVRRGHL